MRPSLTAHLLIVYCVLALAAGQILFKAVSQRTQSLADLATDRTALALFLLALAVYGSSTVVWIAALRTVPLSYAYMFMAGGFVLVPVAAWALFGEPLSPRVLGGAALIALGVWLCAGGRAA